MPFPGGGLVGHLTQLRVPAAAVKVLCKIHTQCYFRKTENLQIFFFSVVETYSCRSFVKTKWHKVNSQKVRGSWRGAAGTGKGLGLGEG